MEEEEQDWGGGGGGGGAGFLQGEEGGWQKSARSAVHVKTITFQPAIAMYEFCKGTGERNMGTRVRGGRYRDSCIPLCILRNLCSSALTSLIFRDTTSNETKSYKQKINKPSL